MSIVVFVPTEKPVVLVRFQAEVKAALEIEAARAGRSLSNLLEKVAVDWLNANGHPEIEMRGPKKRGPPGKAGR